MALVRLQIDALEPTLAFPAIVAMHDKHAPSNEDNHPSYPTNHTSYDGSQM